MKSKNNKSINTNTKVFLIRPLRAIAILDYLDYLNKDWLCNYIEASKDWITKNEWDITQMYIKNPNYKIKELKDKLYNNYKAYGNIAIWNN